MGAIVRRQQDAEAAEGGSVEMYVIALARRRMGSLRRRRTGVAADQAEQQGGGAGMDCGAASRRNGGQHPESRKAAHGRDERGTEAARSVNQPPTADAYLLRATTNQYAACQGRMSERSRTRSPWNVPVEGNTISRAQEGRGVQAGEEGMCVCRKVAARWRRKRAGEAPSSLAHLTSSSTAPMKLEKSTTSVFRRVGEGAAAGEAETAESHVYGLYECRWRCVDLPSMATPCKGITRACPHADAAGGCDGVVLAGGGPEFQRRWEGDGVWDKQQQTA
ncbi:hypothetical protein B0H11DRAFT_1929797 [Mycena galericulata]|nr:hypothetical protein B0H11DRAFT_1929797 [Mycena galericulata]